MRRLTGSIGVEVRDIDLHQDLDDATCNGLRQALLEHAVLVVRDQLLGPEAHLRFSRRFGTPLAPAHYPVVEGYPEIVRVVNYGKANTPTETWHTDWSWMETPPSISIAAAQKLPEAGGDTLFAGKRLAYETLSDGMKRMLEPLQLEHFGPRLLADGRRERVANLHPVVPQHPETGERVLWVGVPGRAVSHFEHMTDAESRPLLDYLLRWSVRPDRVYRHRWQPGDVVLWDNRSLVHYGVHDYGEAERLLHRVTLEGTS